jgi:hypothetical protein
LGLRILWEEHRVKVLENRVLRKIFGIKWDEVVDWRKIYNNKLHNLYSLQYIFRMIRRSSWVWQVVRMRKRRNAYRILVESWK